MVKYEFNLNIGVNKINTKIFSKEESVIVARLVQQLYNFTLKGVSNF